LAQGLVTVLVTALVRAAAWAPAWASGLRGPALALAWDVALVMVMALRLSVCQWARALENV